MDATLTLANTMASTQNISVTQLVNTYSKRLLGFIRKRVPNEADAEDILQDVMYQFVGNTQPIEQVAAWLFRVARNRITDVQRKKKPELLDDVFANDDEDGMLDWRELIFDKSQNPETEYIRSIFWDALQTALDELPAEQREVFLLTEIEGKSYQEIMAATGVAQNTLLSRKRYAVLHLRKRLLTLKNELLNY